MKKHLNVIIICITILMLSHMEATAQFTLSGEVRPRLEVNHGYRNLFDPGLKAGVIFSQRSRLAFDYEHKVFEVKLSIQDVRIWGDQAQLTAQDAAGVSLHEAWGKAKYKDLFIKLGRQELVYNDHRLLGNVGWAQQARSHDAVIMGFEKNGYTLHAVAAYNNDAFDLSKTPYTIPGYRALTFLWFNKTFKEKLELSIIAVANGIENPTDTTIYFTGTFGPHIEYKGDKVGLTATYYYQIGKTNANIGVRAFMAALSASYTVKKTKFKVGADFLSGTNALDGSNTYARTFNTLYGTNHKFYGLMDYFLNIPAHTGNGGLVDLQLGVSSKIGKKSSVLLNGHYFLLANNVNDASSPGNALSKGLGGEIDAVYSLKIHEMVGLKIGWSVLIPSNSLDAINPGSKGRFNTWAWTMFTFKPVFFKSKEKEVVE